MGQLIIEVPQKLNRKITVENAEFAAEVLRHFEELLEDMEDIRDARAALAEPGDNIPWEDVQKRLGLL